MNTLPIMEKLLDLSADQAGGVEACLPDSAKACLPNRQVEWKALGDLINTVTAPTKLNSKHYCETGAIPIIDQGIEFIAGYTDEDLAVVPDGEYIVFGDHSEHIKFVNFRFIQGADGLKILRPKNDSAKYIYYAFQNFYVKELSYKRHWSSAKSTLIPIPPLNVQAEIVRILDAFTAYTAELTAELTARKKQYNHYRDQLLSFSETEACLPNRQVEWKQLGSLAFICDGTHQTPKYTQEGVPFVSVENIRNIYGTTKRISASDFEKYKHKPEVGDILMTRIGDIGTCFVVDQEIPLAYYVTLALIRLDKKVMLPSFLKHLIESYIGVRELRKRTLVNASPIKINLGEIGKISLPVPSLAEQARIVAILDKFDALTASISEGLPREIELRQKQYEYYRDRLLSFPKPASDAAV